MRVRQDAKWEVNESWVVIKPPDCVVEGVVAGTCIQSAEPSTSVSSLPAQVHGLRYFVSHPGLRPSPHPSTLHQLRLLSSTVSYALWRNVLLNITLNSREKVVGIWLPEEDCYFLQETRRRWILQTHSNAQHLLVRNWVEEFHVI